MIILNTAVAGKWLDAILKENGHGILPKVLWWIHEMRGHYCSLDYVKNLPSVAGTMIDSHISAEFWKNRTHDRLGYVIDIIQRSLTILYMCMSANILHDIYSFWITCADWQCLKHLLFILEIAKNSWMLLRMMLPKGFFVNMYVSPLGFDVMIFSLPSSIVCLFSSS